MTASGTGSSMATMQIASPPGLSRPRLSVAMLSPASPISVPNLPMNPGLSWFLMNSMRGASSNSMSMSRTWMMRGRPSENTVPATERSYSSVLTVRRR